MINDVMDFTVQDDILFLFLFLSCNVNWLFSYSREKTSMCLYLHMKQYNIVQILCTWLVFVLFFGKNDSVIC